MRACPVDFLQDTLSLYLVGLLLNMLKISRKGNLIAQALLMGIEPKVFPVFIFWDAAGFPAEWQFAARYRWSGKARPFATSAQFPAKGARPYHRPAYQPRSFPGYSGTACLPSSRSALPAAGKPQYRQSAQAHQDRAV